MRGERKSKLPTTDRIWLWVPRLAGLGLAINDSLYAEITPGEAIFYLVLILGPEAVRLDLLDRGK